MPRRTIAAGAVMTIALSGLGAVGAPAARGAHAAAQRAKVKHVLVLSIDGMHQSDLTWYVTHHPKSALARLVQRGTEYTRAKTTFPSDSFPGMIAQFTGGGAGTAGVYYDDTFNHALLPPNTVNCTTAPRGTEVGWTEAADRSQNPITLDAGQKINDAALTGLPTNSRSQTLAHSAAITKAILTMTPTPQSLLDPGALPTNPATCTPLYPHQYLRVNTVFEVARAHGLRTAWSDKHPAYEILNGPSGRGVQDLFTPEINSVADSAGDDWTTNNALTQEYDGTKVAAVLNEIDGRDHSGQRAVGTPAIFGMNFQSVSTAEKLPVSDALAGGYLSNGNPGPLLSKALDFVNREVGAMVAGIAKRHLTSSTTIILSAKHGQSPKRRADLRRVDDGAIIDAINAAWTSSHPHAAPLVVFGVDDDAMLLWLSNHSRTALAFARHYLLTHSAPANKDGDPKGTYSTSVTRSGLTAVYTGTAADRLFGAPRGDTHAPDLVGLAQHGVVYTGKVKKIAEHGGASDEDRVVPLVVSGAGVRHSAPIHSGVQTTQIAPTILALLGLRPGELQAVRLDHTAVLPR